MTTILIVEDNEKNLKLVRDVLRHTGYRTIEATTAAQGVRLALEELPALVLMDIQLPDFDGITALRKLRDDPRTAALVVVAVSASAMPEDQERILASGFDAYITKPIEIKAFIASVRQFAGPPQSPAQ